MSKFAFAMFVTIIIFSNAQSFSINKEVVPLKVEDEDVYLKTISESVASHLKPIFEEWIQNGPFEVGGNFGPMEFFKNLSQSFSINKEVVPLKVEDEDVYLKTISESVASHLKPIFEEWIQNGPFEVGGNFGPMEFFENLSDAFVRREAAAPTPPNVLESFQKHMEQFKGCIDQTLANTVDEVNAKQVQPVFEVIGDQLNKISKAFEDLTATKAPA